MKVLAHFPVALGAGGGEFDHVVAHAEVDVVHHFHEEAANVF